MIPLEGLSPKAAMHFPLDILKLVGRGLHHLQDAGDVVLHV